jgi:non-ribosomal peptide synthase protein (TIGR01720 family)
MLELHAWVAGGRLEVRWTYCENVHRQTTIEMVARRFMDALRALVAHCRSGRSLEPSVPDPAAFGWEAADLQRIKGAIARSLDEAES